MVFLYPKGGGDVMKVKILKGYYDRQLDKEVSEGTELSVTKVRAIKLIERNLAEEVKAEKKGRVI